MGCMADAGCVANGEWAWGSVSEGDNLLATDWPHRVLESGSWRGGGAFTEDWAQGTQGCPPQPGGGGKLCSLPGVKHPVTTWT